MEQALIILKFIPIIIGFALKRIPFYFEKKNSDVKTIRRRAHQITKKHSNDILRITKTKLNVAGQENIPTDSPVIYLGNHQSYFDVLAMQSETRRPTLFIGKKELLKLPLYSSWMKDMGALFLDREDPREAIKLFNEAAQKMHDEDMDGLIYPEGTRSRSSQVHEFQRGSFKLAEKAKCPIVPVMIEGAYRVLEEDNKLKANQTIYLRFLPPIYMDQLTKEEAKVIHKTVRAQIEAEIEKIHQKS